MIKTLSIRDIPPDVDPLIAIQVLAHAKRELMKDPTRCLTATNKINTLLMIYEGKLS